MLCAVGWGKQLLVGISLDTDVLKEGDDAGRAAQLQELIGVGRAGRVVVRYVLIPSAPREADM